MINSKPLKSLFKPYIKETPNLAKFLIEQVGERKFWKIQFEDECSKATDETCINTECHYNYLKYHENELYIELIQEIQAERLAIKKRNDEQRKKHGYI